MWLRLLLLLHGSMYNHHQCMAWLLLWGRERVSTSAHAENFSCAFFQFSSQCSYLDCNCCLCFFFPPDKMVKFGYFGNVGSIVEQLTLKARLIWRSQDNVAQPQEEMKVEVT